MSKGFLWFLVSVLIVANVLVFYRLGYAQQQKNQNITSNSVSDSLTQTPISNKVVAKYSVAVPILMYHYIRDYTDQTDPIGIGLSVSPVNFQKQLEAIKSAGYHTISLEDFAAHKYGTKPIILTFDDGYDDQFTDAFPILQQEGMTGTFFIVKNFVDQPLYMTSWQIGQLKAAGMEIGGHTIDHKDMATQTYDNAYKEISGGQKGRDPVFAYPSGKYSPSTVLITESLGIKAVVTTELGIATDLSNLQLLPRVRMKNTTDVIKLINDQLYLLDHPTPPAAIPTTTPVTGG